MDWMSQEASFLPFCHKLQYTDWNLKGCIPASLGSLVLAGLAVFQWTVLLLTPSKWILWEHTYEKDVDGKPAPSLRDSTCLKTVSWWSSWFGQTPLNTSIALPEFAWLWTCLRCWLCSCFFFHSFIITLMPRVLPQATSCPLCLTLEKRYLILLYFMTL